MSDQIHGCVDNICHIVLFQLYISHICVTLKRIYKAYNRFALILKSDITNVKVMTQSFTATEILLLV